MFRYDRSRDVEVTVKKLRKPAIVYKIAPSGNSKLASRKIVSVASVAKCWRQKRFRADLYSCFPSSSNCECGSRQFFTSSPRASLNYTIPGRYLRTAEPDTRGWQWRKRKGKEAYLYSAILYTMYISKRSPWITQSYLQIHHSYLSS